MFSSSVIPTIGRPTLERAVHSILAQRGVQDDCEVIVVNDSGRPLAPAAWMGQDRVRVVDTNRRDRSVARNTGAAMARGRYLHFLDDDDWLLPGAMARLRHLVMGNAAAWAFGGYRLVDRTGGLVRECRPDESGNCFVRFMAGEWLPFQASLIRADAFFDTGGFAPLPSLLGGSEDIHLARQISLRHPVCGTPELVAAIEVGNDGSTTNYTNIHAQHVQSREMLLRERRAAVRVIASARERPRRPAYWMGRVVRMYLSSTAVNATRGLPATAALRGSQAAVATIRSGRYVFSKHFWRGIGRPHLNSVWLERDIAY